MMHYMQFMVTFWSFKFQHHPQNFQKKPDVFKKYSTFECLFFQDTNEKIKNLFKLMP